MKKTDRRLLEFQSDRIEAVLARHKVSARVTGGYVGSQWIQFQLVCNQIGTIKGLAGKLMTALGVSDCRVSRQINIVIVEIPRSWGD